MASAHRRFKDSIYEQLARLGKAVSAPKRLELLDLLCQGPRTVEALAEQAALSRRERLAAPPGPARGAAGRGREEGPLRRVPARGRRGLPVLRRAARARRVAARRGRPASRARYFEQRGALEPVERERAAPPGEGAARSRSSTSARPRSTAPATSPGALSMPVGELHGRLEELPKGREIVAYCRGPYCVMAVEAVELLREEGLPGPPDGAGRRRLARARLAGRGRPGGGARDEAGAPRAAREPRAVLAARRRQRVRRRDGRHGAHASSRRSPSRSSTSRRRPRCSRSSSSSA